MEGSIIIIIILRQYKIILNFPTIKNSLIGVGYRIIETEGQKKKKKKKKPGRMWLLRQGHSYPNE